MVKVTQNFLQCIVSSFLSVQRVKAKVSKLQGFFFPRNVVWGELPLCGEKM